MKTTSILVAVASLAFAANAATWWVDDDNYGNGGTGTEANPFGTIQDALDNPGFTAGDTVKVKAGVYNKGVAYHSSGGTTGNRVVITNKVHIIAVDGRENTFIVGANATTSPNSAGQGADAVRCILYRDKKYSSGAAIVEGFTICGGRTKSSDDQHGFAAGLFDASDSSAGRYQIWLVDCTISNCVAGAGGATRFGSLYRCLVTDCKASVRVSGIHGAHAHSCVISHCVEPVTSTKYGLAAQAVAVNCTFFANKTCLAPESGSYRMYSYNCIIAGDGNYEFPYSGSTSTAMDGFHQLFAPAVGDYRPFPGTRAVTLGDAANLSQVAVPNDVKPLINGVRTLVDYAGNSYPSTGTIAAGAIQEVAPPPAGGALQFNVANCTVNGHSAHDGAYVYPETYPTQYVLKATDKTVYCYYRDVGGTSEMIVPCLDDSAILMPPPSVREISTNTVQYAAAERWIDPVTGNDSNVGTDPSAPLKTLQKGFESVRGGSGYHVVHVAAGDYREGGAAMKDPTTGFTYNDIGSTLTNRLCIGTGYAVRFKGAGPGRSIIHGAPDPFSGTGYGTAAIKPLTIYSATAIVQGFTLTGGYTKTDNSTGSPDDIVVFGRTLSDPAHVADCIVTGCHASDSVSKNVRWYRTKFIDNVLGGTIIYNSETESCLFSGNTYGSGRSGICGNSYGCTFYGNRATDIPFGNSIDVMACAIYGSSQLRSGTRFHGCVAENVATAFNYSGVVGDVIAFNDSANGDFSVKIYSGATRCVPSLSDNPSFWADYWRHACGDVDGKPSVFTGGSVLAGAVQETVAIPGKIYVGSPKGGLGDGTAAYAEGEYDVSGGTLAVGPAVGTRPCIGFTVDGVTNLFDDASSLPIAVPAADAGSTVLAIYGTDWYVDAENGSDNDYGFTPKMPKRTLAAVLGANGIASGDTVHAAAGTYAEGVMTNSANTKMGSRAIVPQGVTLVGAGADRSVIVGAEATVAADEYGCGTNAVRCVALNRYATVKGFALTGGRTCCHLGGKDHRWPDNLGGGVGAIGASISTTQADRNVIDCVISNNVGYRAGGAAYVTLRRCRVIGNRGTDVNGNSSGTYYCRHYGSVLDSQSSGGTYGGAMYPLSLCECTLRETDGKYVLYLLAEMVACEIRNSLILGKSQIIQVNSIATNSFFTVEPKITSGYPVLGPGSQVVNAALLQFDGDLRPVVGANSAIDAGNASLLGAEDLTSDCYGGQRVYNNALDIGAVEADWRAKYAADLGGRYGFSVTAASPEVEETVGGKVRLVSDTTLDTAWLNGAKARNISYSFSLDAGSVLVVTLDGVSTTYDTAGAHEFRFKSTAGSENVVSFACTAGAAELLSADRLIGTVFTFR